MAETPAQKPDNNLVWALLCTTLCCMPLGVVAIVKAVSVDTLWAAGNYSEAEKAAQDARKWAMIGAICGVVIWCLYLAYILAVVLIAACAASH